MKLPRIVLADSHVLLTDAIKQVLEPEFEVVGTFTDGRALVHGAPALNPDIIVLDISLPSLNGLVAGQRLKQLIPAVKLIYLTANSYHDLADEAFRIGASGYLIKNCRAAELVHAISQASIGQSYVTPLLTQEAKGSELRNAEPKSHLQTLTLRQKQVLQLLAEGHSMKEVAFMLKVTPRTVAFHKYAMMEHLHVRTSAELILFAVKSSIVRP
jgi:DNA-binding NarL/FixJ family response regulator